MAIHDSAATSPTYTPVVAERGEEGLLRHMRKSEHEDYLIRMIQEVGRALASIRQSLFGGAASAETVREELNYAADVLMGSDRAMVELIDVESAVRLLGSAARTRQWIELLELEAEAWRRSGEVERANRLLDRARAALAVVDQIYS